MEKKVTETLTDLLQKDSPNPPPLLTRPFPDLHKSNTKIACGNIYSFKYKSSYKLYIV